MEVNAIQRKLRYVVDPEERTTLYQLLNPKIIKLSVAENVLLFDDLRENLFDKLKPIVISDVEYVTNYGDDELRQQAAGFLSQSFDAQVDWQHVFGVSGVSAGLECLAFALCKPGDVAIAPAPCWQGFRWCFAQRPQVDFEPFHLTHRGMDQFQLTLEDIQKACHEKHPRMLVLTNPHNPLGVNYDSNLLEEIYDWALNKTDMHIISDEMYCHSQVGQPEPPFKSALALQAYKRASEEHKERVHIVWGFAKDFGLSGLKAAFIVSQSPQVRKALQGDPNEATNRVQSMAWFSPFDSLKHFVFKQLFADPAPNAQPASYARYLMHVYQKALTSQHDAVTALLKEKRIEYFRPSDRANAGQFLWLDLRKYLELVPPQKLAALSAESPFPDIDKRELPLFNYIKSHDVLLLPGTVLFSPLAGFFRMCYTAVPLDMVRIAVDKLARALSELEKAPRR